MQFAACAILLLSVPVAGWATAFHGAPLSALLCALAVYGAGAALAGASLRRGFPHEILGWCNVITLFRLALMTVLVVPLAAPGTAAHALTVFALAGAALALDGADGWLARRDRRVSDFGARFDMEVDSALALVLALLALRSGDAGALVLVLGLARYAFGLAGLVWPWLTAPLPPRFARKVVCVAQLAVLIALQLPQPLPWLTDLMVGAVAAGLVWSFGRDILWLRQARP